MEQGLTIQEAKEKLQTFGKNVVETSKPLSPFSIFLSQFPTLINGILALAAILSFVLGDALDGIFIFIILILNGFFGFIQEYRAEKSLEKLKNYIASYSRVIREGKETQINSSEIVPRDIVVVSEGERIPADGKLTTHHSLEIDESLLTGESLPIIKQQGDYLFSGTLVSVGKGHLHVEKTGAQTRFGQIAQTLATVISDKTPLQIRLDSLGKILSVVAILFSLLLIPIGIFQGKELFPLFLLAVSLSVAAIPEGLPAVVTIALAIGTNRMAKKNAIVRKMAAIETLGAVQILLTDKTGTLTQNKMRVKTVWTRFEIDRHEILKICILGNTALLVKKGQEKEFDIVGDKTDGALLLFAQQELKDIEEVKQEGEIIEEYSFDPNTKLITTVWKKNETIYSFVRGAPESILKHSNLSLQEKEEIIRKFEQYAKEGLRIIGFGRKVEHHHQTHSRDHFEQKLEFLGFVGIYDPPRVETKHAVHEAKQAGIHTVMVTGDNELTALTIAREIELIEQDEDVVTGDELDKLNDEELKKLLVKTRIFARTKPEDKLRLATLYKKLGFVVGVTGDGVNDALALKRADVGVAMGEEGTDVAKEAADIVLTDDNYSTLVHAIEEGRTIYNNILKAITYLLSGNLAEISLVFFGALLGLPSPLLPTQILWINLVTDGIPALALASDTKDPDLLRHKPRDPKSPILSNHRLFFISSIGFGLAIVCLFVYTALLLSTTETFARTVTFNLLVVLHLLIAFAVRKVSILHVNKLLVFGFILTLLLQFIISTHPFFQKIFHLGV